METIKKVFWKSWNGNFVSQESGVRSNPPREDEAPHQYLERMVENSWSEGEYIIEVIRNDCNPNTVLRKYNVKKITKPTAKVEFRDL
jgi:hypothetical protein